LSQNPYETTLMLMGRRGSTGFRTDNSRASKSACFRPFLEAL